MAQSLFPQLIIARKRDGLELSREEIAAVVRAATDGSWADYQLTAWLMAVFLRGMTPAEVAIYTEEMMNSGVVADLSHVPGIKVDKHSTGGVGDKVSLPLAAMVTACGVPVPMISGRGLGHTGGTLDKLESIPGFNVNLSLTQYAGQVARLGCALIGQTRDLAPSDKKLYALRDVTATVECVPLICGSIMSKKLAEGIDALVLDVKYGRGAFMKDLGRARELAQTMIGIGKAMGKPTRALITSMDQPLGRAVGNALEVAESIECLRGNGPVDLMEVTYALGAQMLMLAGVAADEKAARAKLADTITDGSALAKFREIVVAQGGDAKVIDDPRKLPAASHRASVVALADGYVTDVEPMAIALAALKLGAGRVRAEDAVDPAVGISELVKIGEKVAKGDVLATIHANDTMLLEDAMKQVGAAIRVADQAPAAQPPLIAEMLS